MKLNNLIPTGGSVAASVDGKEVVLTNLGGEILVSTWADVWSPAPEPEPTPAPKQPGKGREWGTTRKTMSTNVSEELLARLREAARSSDTESINEWCENAIISALDADPSEIPADPGNGSHKLGLYLLRDVREMIADFAEEHCPNPTLRKKGSKAAAIRRLLAWSLDHVE